MKPLPFSVKAVGVVATGLLAATLVPGVAMAAVPSAPTGLTATRGNAQVTLQYTAPTVSPAVTGYTATATNTSTSATTTQSCSTSTTCVYTGLTNGTAYSFTVSATNTDGTSGQSSPATATPSTTPGAPTGVTATGSNSQATVSWTAPGSNGGSAITGYTVTSSGSQTCTTTGATTCTVTGLTNGTPYTFTVTATNVAGTSTASTASSAVTPAPIAPDAPTGVSATGGNGSATVSFSPPGSNGGSAITGYTATSSGGQTGTCTTSPCTVSGLTNGTSYTFTVRATNAAGTSTASTASAAVIPAATVPGVPSALRVTGADRALQLSFTAPSSSGASPVTGYQVSLDNGITWHGLTTSGTSPITASYGPVLNGQTYSARVRAVNSVGAGVATAATTVTVPNSFADPLSAAVRANEIRVPARPRSYNGRKRHTTATYRAADGTTATTIAGLGGRQLQGDQAVQILSRQLFTSGKAKLTSGGRARLQTLANSLKYGGAITCEGYSDYALRATVARRLADYRSVVVCRTLVADGAPVTTHSRSYGASRPILVGGKAKGYQANNRVVVKVATS